MHHVSAISLRKQRSDDAFDLGDADDDVVRIEDNADVASHGTAWFQLPPSGAAAPDLFLAEPVVPADGGDCVVVRIFLVVVQDFPRSDFHGDDFGHHRPSVQSTSLSLYQDGATFGHVVTVASFACRFDRALWTN